MLHLVALHLILKQEGVCVFTSNKDDLDKGGTGVIDTIENGILKAVVKLTGAELVSLKSCDEQLEYLWQDDADSYSGHSPLLFPIVGSLPDDRYTYEGVSYEMGLHGFGSQLKFDLVEKQMDMLFYQTQYNHETLQQYPFKFKLGIRYALVKKMLIIRFEITNLDKGIMLFSIGAHPFFRCPLGQDEDISDYMLIFEKPETVKRRIKEGSLLTGETEDFLNQSREVKLSHSLFDRGAIILEGTRSKWVEMRNPNHKKAVRVYYTGFPYLGIWSFGDSPFVCIEPWCGIDSTFGDSHDLTKKEGLLKLNPRASFTCEYRIKVI